MSAWTVLTVFAITVSRSFRAESTTTASSSASSSSFQDPVRLSFQNYTEATAGKTVFIKFFAPWCEHSRKIKATWEKLAADWKDDDVGLIAEVDCSDKADPETGGEKLCRDFDIEGLPTLLYGDPADKSSLEEYPGGDPNYDDLSAFAREHLKPICSPSNQAGCDGETNRTMALYRRMVATGELDEKIKSLEAEMEEAESAFQNEVDRMMKVYNAAMTEKELLVARINSELRILRTIRKDNRRKGKQ